MQVEILIGRQWQDAGVERPLSVGVVYDLPDGVACALIATGAAKRLPMVAPERAVVMSAPERKGKRSAA